MRLSELLPGKQLGVTTASWSVILIYLPMLRIPRALGCNTYSSLWFSFMLCVSAVFVPSFPHPLLSKLSIGVTDARLLSGVGAHGWLVRFCQSSVQSPPWGWLPIVEALGCLGHPTLAE